MRRVERGSGKFLFMRVVALFVGLICLGLGIWFLTNPPPGLGIFYGIFIMIIAVFALYARITGRFEGSIGFDDDGE